jgi:hypothetical protein
VLRSRSTGTDHDIRQSSGAGGVRERKKARRAGDAPGLLLAQRLIHGVLDLLAHLPDVAALTLGFEVLVAGVLTDRFLRLPVISAPYS